MPRRPVVVRVLPDFEAKDAVLAYRIYTAWEENLDYPGRILFDVQWYRIYDGELLTVNEQEQLALFILNHREA